MGQTTSLARVCGGGVCLDGGCGESRSLMNPCGPSSSASLKKPLTIFDKLSSVRNVASGYVWRSALWSSAKRRSGSLTCESGTNCGEGGSGTNCDDDLVNFPPLHRIDVRPFIPLRSPRLFTPIVVDIPAPQEACMSIRKKMEMHGMCTAASNRCKCRWAGRGRHLPRVK